MQTKHILLLILTLFTLTIVFSSCKKKKLDENLYEESKAENLLFYKNKDTLYSAKANSPHGSFKLKFNAIAFADLDVDGKLPTGKAFSEGALIVKEIYSGSSISLIAVMKKDGSSKFGRKNWLWAEYNGSGKAIYSVGDKGKGCVNCHSEGLIRDFSRSFDLH